MWTLLSYDEQQSMLSDTQRHISVLTGTVDAPSLFLYATYMTTKNSRKYDSGLVASTHAETWHYFSYTAMAIATIIKMH